MDHRVYGGKCAVHNLFAAFDIRLAGCAARSVIPVHGMCQLSSAVSGTTVCVCRISLRVAFLWIRVTGAVLFLRLPCTSIGAAFC